MHTEGKDAPKAQASSLRGDQVIYLEKLKPIYRSSATKSRRNKQTSDRRRRQWQPVGQIGATRSTRGLLKDGLDIGSVTLGLGDLVGAAGLSLGGRDQVGELVDRELFAVPERGGDARIERRRNG